MSAPFQTMPPLAADERDAFEHFQQKVHEAQWELEDGLLALRGTRGYYPDLLGEQYFRPERP